MQVILESTWQRVISNFKKGRMTYIWIDEFHLFLASKFGRDYIKKFIKRCRKYNAVATAVTQNIEEILEFAKKLFVPFTKISIATDIAFASFSGCCFIKL